MAPDRSHRPFIRTKDAADRYSDAAGPAAADHPRLREQLEIIVGRRLSQFSMAVNGIRLTFWGEEAGSISSEIHIEHNTLDLARAGEPATSHQWDEDVVATSLLSTLEQKLTHVDVTGGYLSLAFDNDLRLRVEPDQHYESWQISSANNLLIVCMPGGDLSVWYPDTSG